jgi:hypothetical protein
MGPPFIQWKKSRQNTILVNILQNQTKLISLDKENEEFG